MATIHTVLKSARLFHLYSGVFLAPALLFFAFTGGIQTFSLHETTRGSTYKPPAILVELGQLHKKQTVIVPVRKASPDEAKPGSSPAKGSSTSESHLPDSHPGGKHDHKADTGPSTTPGGAVPAAAQPTVAVQPPPPATPSPAAPTKAHNLLPMKIFFLVVAVGLFSSTLTGLYMAYRFARRKNTISLTLLAGIVIPLLLLLF